jgi:hypothetical protein
MNDTFFYASSWGTSTILSYSYINSTWKYTVFVNPMTGVDGSHITLDDCGRVWHVIFLSGLYIYDSSGIRIASWNITWGTDSIYDIIIFPNYILLLTQVNGEKDSAI